MRFKLPSTGLNCIFGWGQSGSTTNWGGIFVGGNFTGSYADESLGWIINGRIGMYVRNGTDFYNDNVEHSLVVPCGDGNNRIYIDGVLQTVSFNVGSASTANALITSTSFDSLAIGKRFYPGSPLYMTGTACDVRIYDSTNYFGTNNAEIYHDNVGNDGLTTGIKARYRIDENSEGQTIINPIDISGNSYNGSPTNSPTYIATPLKIG
jgi:hypothetical protein